MSKAAELLSQTLLPAPAPVRLLLSGFVLDVCRGDGCIVRDMKIKAFFPLICSGLLAAASGCVGTNDGHSTAGVPFARDTIVDRYERPVSQLAAATRIVLTRNGKLLVDNVVNNTFEARVNERKVWVKVSDVDGKVSQVSVQVRGPVGADLPEAHELSKQIALQLMAGVNQ
jgi:hypothetical protein